MSHDVVVLMKVAVLGAVFFGVCSVVCDVVHKWNHIMLCLEQVLVCDCMPTNSYPG